MTEILLTEIYELLESGSQVNIKELINEKKTELGISSDLQLSKILSIDRTTLSRILSGEVGKVDLFSVLKITQFLGVGLEKIAQVYVASLKPEFIGELEQAGRFNFIVKNFDLAGLKKSGIIDNFNDLSEVEKRLLEFFELNSIFEYNSEDAFALFSRTKAYSNDKMREVWVRSAYFQFARIPNINEYDREALLLLLPNIRSYTRYEEKGFLTVLQALYHVGITVIVQPYLTKTQVKGGTFIIKDKPCIVLTDYKKSYPTLWFTLLHEIYHVLYDFEALQGWKYHLTGESDTLLFREDDADYFAKEMLFSQEKLNYIRYMMNSPAMVVQYAEKNSVHPSIIYSFYCWDEERKGKKVWGLYDKFIPNSDKPLKAVKTNPWDKRTLFNEIDKIKTYLTTVK
jgi:HTH-type transcriptional regulator / antitoxin HigA